MPAPHYSVFYRPDALSAAQPTASKHWRYEKIASETNIQNTLYVSCILLVTASTVQRASCRIKSKGQFWRYSPRGDTLHQGRLLHVKFHPPSVHRSGVWAKKLKLLRNFYKISEHKLSTGLSLARFLLIFQRLWGSIMLGHVKIGENSIKGIHSYGGINLRGSSYPKFLMPLSSETVSDPTFSKYKNVLKVLSLCQVWWGSDFTCQYILKVIGETLHNTHMKRVINAVMQSANTHIFLAPDSGRDGLCSLGTAAVVAFI